MISFLKKLELFENFTWSLSYDIFYESGFFRYTLYIMPLNNVGIKLALLKLLV